MTNYTQKAIRGTIIITAATFLGALLGYLFRIILARKLSVYEYGVFFSIYSLLSLIFLFRDLGLGSAICKYIPEFLIKKDHKSLKLSLILTSSITIGISTILFISISLLSKVISTYYLKDGNYTFFIIMAALIFAFFSIDALIANILAALQKHLLYAIFQLLRQSLCIILLILLFLIHTDLYMILYAYLLTSLILIILFLAILKKLIPSLKKSKVSYDKKLSKDMLKFGMSVIFSGIGGLILQYSDSIMIALYMTSTDVGIYNAAVPIYSMLIYVGAALTVVLVPMISELWTNKARSSIEYSIKVLYKYVLLTFLPLCILVIIYSDFIIQTLFGPGYAAASMSLKILMIGSLVYLLTQINFSVLIGIGKPGAVAKFTIIGAVINILLNIVLIPLYGITGAAITTTCGYLLMFILSTYLIRKKMNMQLPVIDWLKTLLISAAFIFLIAFLKNILVMNVFLKVFTIGAISLIVYVILAFYTKLLDISEIKNFIQKYRE